MRKPTDEEMSCIVNSHKFTENSHKKYSMTALVILFLFLGFEILIGVMAIAGINGLSIGANTILALVIFATAVITICVENVEDRKVLSKCDIELEEIDINLDEIGSLSADKLVGTLEYYKKFEGVPSYK